MRPQAGRMAFFELLRSSTCDLTAGPRVSTLLPRCSLLLPRPPPRFLDEAGSPTEPVQTSVPTKTSLLPLPPLTRRLDQVLLYKNPCFHLIIFSTDFKYLLWNYFVHIPLADWTLGSTTVMRFMSDSPLFPLLTEYFCTISISWESALTRLDCGADTEALNSHWCVAILLAILVC